jgi:hypothetical protein
MYSKNRNLQLLNSSRSLNSYAKEIDITAEGKRRSRKGVGKNSAGKKTIRITFPLGKISHKPGVEKRRVLSAPPPHLIQSTRTNWIRYFRPCNGEKQVVAARK